MLNNFLVDLLYIIPGIIIAISFHEYAHARMAYAMGDDTAKRYGRMTVNPMSHIDPIGLMMLVVARFGWAKPVPVNESNFKNRKMGSILVSIAGVSMNILIALLAFLILHFTRDILPGYEFRMVMFNVASINVSFAAFNLLPIPPLDGSKILVTLLPAKHRYIVYKYENYGTIVMLLLILTGTLGIILNPVINIILNFIQAVINIIL